MTGIDRSKLFCRTFLFLFVLLGAPMAARCDALEDAARELAHKIYATLPGRDIENLTALPKVIVEIRNLSLLSPDDVLRIKRVLETSGWEVSGPAVGGDKAITQALITLSENFRSYVWTAEVRRADKLETVFTTFLRPTETRITSDAIRMSLHSEKFWEGPEHIIDVTFVFLPNFEQRMVLLTPDGLILMKVEKGSEFKRIPFAPGDSVEREPTGVVSQIGNRVEAMVDRRECDVSLATQTLERCFVPTPMLLKDHVGTEMLGIEKPNYGDQIKFLPNSCGVERPTLAIGTGDYTQPDSVRILEYKTVVSNELRLAGPVLRFSQGPDTQYATAIVHNLKDGNYEVYRLSADCGQ